MARRVLHAQWLDVSVDTDTTRPAEPVPRGRSMKATTGVALHSLLLVALGGCGADAQPDRQEGTSPIPSDIAPVKQELWTISNWTNRGQVQYWPKGVVPTCFTAGGGYTTSNPDYIARKSAAIAILESEYEHIPNVAIDFQGFADCTSAPN